MYKIEVLETNKLLPYAKNARTHSEEQIKQIADSIKEFGFTNPILIDKDNGIIAGHGRVLAAANLHIETLPCLRLSHLTETQKRAYVLADNKLALNAGWNEELLKLELEELKEDFDIGLIGFSDNELDKIFESSEAEDDDFDVDEALESIVEPITKRGDIWLLGRHKLMCGDSTKAEDVKNLMGDMKADLFITDPPYNVEYTGKTKEALKIQNDKMSSEDFNIFLKNSFSAANDVLKPGGVFYIWHADSNRLNFELACREVSWKPRQTLIWVKNVMVMGRQDYQWQHEPCLYGWKEGAAHLCNMDRKQTTALNFDRPTKSTVHPTMKPIPLFDYEIQNNTKGEDIILDSFLGSGTTILACEQNGRICYGLELDEKYCDVIVKRWEEFTGKKAVKSES